MLRHLPHSTLRITTTVLLGATLALSAILAVGVASVVVPSRASAATAPPWEPDPSSVGALTFYNAAGNVITGGNITDAPIAAYVQGTATIRSGDTKASLYGYLPVSGESPGQWSGEVLSGSTAYPNATAPSPLNTSTLPVVTGAAGDETVQQLVSDFPNHDTSSDGYANIYVLRLKTSAPSKPGNTTYDSADIEISGTTWSVVYPQTTATTTTTASVNPTSTTAGSSVAYSTTVTSGSGTPTGTVAFTVGSTALCTATLASGAGSCNASNAPVGADTVTATYSGTTSFGTSTGTTLLVVTSGPYSPLAPVRICDTRASNPSGLINTAAQCNGGAGNPGSTIAKGGTKTITVANNFGIPANATAVVFNVTVVNPASSGFLTVFPAGAAQPTASNVNFVAGEVVPNLVEVGLGTSGQVSFYSSAQTDLVVDVEGYAAPTAVGGAGAGLYTALPSPIRICDTRAGNPSGLSTPNDQCNGTANAGKTLGANGNPSTINVKVANANGIPTGATAAVFNVTVVNSRGAGFLTVFPQGTTQPLASNVNYTAGQVTSNRVIVPLSTSGTTPGYISVFSSSPADIIVDVSGYYSAAGGTGTQFSAEGAPVRICDTRVGNPSGLSGGASQCLAKTIGAAKSLTLNVSGLAGVPSGAKAVVINLTGVTPSAPNFLTVFPNALPSPLVSDLNEVKGDVKANLVVATLSSTGTISVYNNTGSVDVVIDVLGWYS